MHRPVIVRGVRFGRAIALSATATWSRKGKSGIVLCLCDCGRKFKARYCWLKTGGVKSCGCLQVESRFTAKRTHGFTSGPRRVPEYNVWASMKARCENPKATGFKNYGGRGIRVVRRWSKFENFIADMGMRPSVEHTLDRRNNDGNYGPRNCRWTTLLVQNRNKRNVRVLTVNGRTGCVSQWAEWMGIHKDVIKQRLNKLGWSPKRSVLTPVRRLVRGRKPA